MNKHNIFTTQKTEANPTDFQKPYASIDLSNVFNTPDGNTGIKITLLHPSIPNVDASQANATGETSTALANANTAEEIMSRKSTKGSNFVNRKINVTPLTKSVNSYIKSEEIGPRMRSFVVGKGFDHTDLSALSKYKGKVVSLEELQQHVNIPGLSDKLKAKSGSKLKIVMLKKNQIQGYLDNQTLVSNKGIRYNVQDNKMKKKPIPLRMRKALEILPHSLPNMNKYEHTTLLPFNEQRLDSVKCELEEYLKGIPYDPNMKFSNVLQKFIVQRHRQQPVAALQRDHKPEDSEYSKYAVCCAVPKCGNAIFRHGSDWEPFETPQSFFTFPDDRKMAEKWMTIIHRSDLKGVPHEELLTYRICEGHFRDCDFANDDKSELSTDAMPFNPEKIRKPRQRQVKKLDFNENTNELHPFPIINATYETTEAQESVDLENIERQKLIPVTLKLIQELHTEQEKYTDFDIIELTDQLNILPVSNTTDETLNDLDQIEESVDLENDETEQLTPVMSDHSYTDMCAEENVILHDNDFEHPVFYEEIVEEDDINFADLTS